MPSSVTYLSLDEVLAIHALVLDYGGGANGVRDLGLVDSAIGRPQSGYYADLVEMAGALMESLLINHPFVDGNKRTALVAADTFLRANGFRLDLDPEQAFEFIIGSLERHSLDFAALVPWIHSSVTRHPDEANQQP